MSMGIPVAAQGGNGRGRRTRESAELERRFLCELREKQSELEHQLTRQRKLLEVNERLLTMLDPQGSSSSSPIR